jgi:hypothetical protein
VFSFWQVIESKSRCFKVSSTMDIDFKHFNMSSFVLKKFGHLMRTTFQHTFGKAKVIFLISIFEISLE